MPFPKPEPRRRVKARRVRLETKVKHRIRAACMVRDGERCRFSWFGNCAGPLEWAHLEEQKRARTRGQAPERRHTTAGTCMLCRAHHRAYDAGLFEILNQGPIDANKPFVVATTAMPAALFVSAPAVAA